MLLKAKFKAKHKKSLKILTPNLTIQRLGNVLAQVKAGNTSENLNGIRQIKYSHCRAKEITKKYLII